MSSAKRDGRRVVSVLLGAPNENGRIESSRALLNYGFNAYENAKLAAAGEAQRAIDAAKQLPDNAYSAALLQLATDLLGRRS